MEKENLKSLLFFDSRLIRNIFSCRLILSLALVIASLLFFSLFSQNYSQGTSSPFLSLWLFTAILISSFSILREAKFLAEILGEPFASLILTISIVFIELILISAVLLGPDSNPYIGRDAIFSVMMIIMNLIIGFAMLAGGLKHGSQDYNPKGTLIYLKLIAFFLTLSFAWPFIRDLFRNSELFDRLRVFVGALKEENLFLSSLFSEQGVSSQISLSPAEGLFIAFVILTIYLFFLYWQISICPEEFQSTKSRGQNKESCKISSPKKECSGSYLVPVTNSFEPEEDFLEKEREEKGLNSKKARSLSVSSWQEIIIRSIILIFFGWAVAHLSKHLSPSIDLIVDSLGAPTSLAGFIIAALVFMPESLATFDAALDNQMQRVINLCHGGFLSTVGITVPALFLLSFFTSKEVSFLLSLPNIIFMALTIFISFIFFSGSKSNFQKGLVHILIFICFFAYNYFNF